MLHVKFNTHNDFIPDENTIVDVDKEFAKLKIKCSAYERKVIELIDKGKLLDGKSYIDRFGFKLRLSEISSGSKTALCVINNPDKIVDTAECGLNALSAIICVCRNGNILVRDIQIKLPVIKGCNDIDVECMGRHFTKFNEFNDWYHNESWRCGDVCK